MDTTSVRPERNAFRPSISLPFYHFDGAHGKSALRNSPFRGQRPVGVRSLSRACCQANRGHLGRHGRGLCLLWLCGVTGLLRAVAGKVRDASRPHGRGPAVRSHPAIAGRIPDEGRAGGDWKQSHQRDCQCRPYHYDGASAQRPPSQWSCRDVPGARDLADRTDPDTDVGSLRSVTVLKTRRPQ